MWSVGTPSCLLSSPDNGLFTVTTIVGGTITRLLVVYQRTKHSFAIMRRSVMIAVSVVRSVMRGQEA